MSTERESGNGSGNGARALETRLAAIEVQVRLHQDRIGQMEQADTRADTRLYGIESREALWLTQRQVEELLAGAFKGMLVGSLTDPEVGQALARVMDQALSRSGVLTETRFVRWLALFFLATLLLIAGLLVGLR